MIYVFLANGFEEIEALSAVDVLRRAEYDVKTVGVGGKSITGAHGITVLADIEDREVVTGEELRAIVLPGGMPGALNLEKSPIVRAAAEYCAETGRIVAAICAAPSVLGHWGLLKGRSATCFPGFENELDGAAVVEAPVCMDGNFITGKGPGPAIAFALLIVKALSGEQLANKIRMSMQCM